MWINGTFGDHSTLITAPQPFRFDVNYVAQALTNWVRLPSTMHWPLALPAVLSTLCALLLLLRFIPVASLDRLREYQAGPHYRVSLCMLGAFLPLIIVASVAESYDYTVNPRQFIYVRPLLFVLAVVPLLATFTRRRVPWNIAGGVLLAWIALHQVESLRLDMLNRPRPYPSPYGRDDLNYRPVLPALIDWLEQNTSSTDLVISGYYDEICLESGLPVKHLLPDMASVEATARLLSRERGHTIDRLVLVLPSTSYGHRELPSRSELLTEFGLQPVCEGPLRELVLTTSLSTD